MQATTLVAPFTADSLALRVASVAGAIVGGIAKIDNEYTKIVQIVSPIVYVRERGGEGGTAMDHDTNAPVVFATGAELPGPGRYDFVPAPGEERDVISIGSDLTIGALLKRDAVITITKPSAAAVTLEAPSLTSDGIQVTITSQSAFAHIITATGLIDDGVTGGSKSTLTFAAFPGASVTLMAAKGKWTVLGKVAVT